MLFFLSEFNREIIGIMLMLRPYVAKQNIYDIFIMSDVLPLGTVHKLLRGEVGQERGESCVSFLFAEGTFCERSAKIQNGVWRGTRSVPLN